MNRAGLEASLVFSGRGCPGVSTQRVNTQCRYMQTLRSR